MACKRRISVRRIVFFAAIYAGVAFGVGSFVVAKMVTREAMTKETVVQAAEWDVGITGTSTQSGDDKVGVVAGNEDEQGQQSYTLTVTNDSDTASKYTIKLSGVPAGVMAGLDGGTLKNPNNSGVITFSETGKELGAHKNRNHTIEFAAKLSAESVAEHNVSVEVVFTQKEPQ